MSRLFIRVAVSLLLVLFGAAAASALDYKDYIGFRQLQAELGSSTTPTGADVVVSQVEAGNLSSSTYYYLPFSPGSSDADFTDKTIHATTTPAGNFWHATNVGRLFYGNNSSIAPGITSIYGYDTGYWLGSAFLRTGTNFLPYATSARVANHSWIGTSSYNLEILKRLDWVINRDEYIQVVAMNNPNNGGNMPLLGSSFNAIAVGLSNGTATHGSYSLGSSSSPYNTTGRTRPDLVVPLDATSYATPVVSAAAALLVEVGHKNPALSTDPAVQYTTNRNEDIIYNAERSEVVKAALMAGASRTSPNLTNTVTPQGYAVDTDNGLNSTYGAGQLNIYNSYHIIAAGEQNSLQDAPGTQGYIGSYGFDYDPYFGGSSGSNETASYLFTASADGKMTASLVWNLAVNDGTLDATLYNLGLYLYDITDNPDGELVGKSVGLLDNTENLWLSLEAGHTYLLQVQALGDDFLWDYALAWDLVPVPGTVYLLGTGFLVLVGFRRKFRS